MHTYLQHTSEPKFYTLIHGPGSWTLQEKEGKSTNGPVHGPPLQARVAAANGTVLQLANCCTEDKLLALTNCDPGAHGHEQVGKQN